MSRSIILVLVVVVIVVAVVVMFIVRNIDDMKSDKAEDFDSDTTTG